MARHMLESFLMLTLKVLEGGARRRVFRGPKSKSGSTGSVLRWVQTVAEE